MLVRACVSVCVHVWGKKNKKNKHKRTCHTVKTLKSYLLEQRVKGGSQHQRLDLKGYGHFFHKLVLLVVSLGEVVDVVLQPLDLTLHVVQTGLQNLCRDWKHTGKKERLGEKVGL